MTWSLAFAGDDGVSGTVVLTLGDARASYRAELVVPEPVTSRQEYHDVILRPIWQAIAPHDPDDLLQQEWLNSRGAQ